MLQIDHFPPNVHCFFVLFSVKITINLHHSIPISHFLLGFCAYHHPRLCGTFIIHWHISLFVKIRENTNMLWMSILSYLTEDGYSNSYQSSSYCTSYNICVLLKSTGDLDSGRDWRECLFYNMEVNSENEWKLIEDKY